MRAPIQVSRAMRRDKPFQSSLRIEHGSLTQLPTTTAVVSSMRQLHTPTVCKDSAPTTNTHSERRHTAEPRALQCATARYV